MSRWVPITCGPNFTFQSRVNTTRQHTAGRRYIAFKSFNSAKAAEVSR